MCTERVHELVMQWLLASPPPRPTSIHQLGHDVGHSRHRPILHHITIPRQVLDELSASVADLSVVCPAIIAFSF